MDGLDAFAESHRERWTAVRFAALSPGRGFKASRIGQTRKGCRSVPSVWARAWVPGLTWIMGRFFLTFARDGRSGPAPLVLWRQRQRACCRSTAQGGGALSGVCCRPRLGSRKQSLPGPSPGMGSKPASRLLRGAAAGGLSCRLHHSCDPFASHAVSLSIKRSIVRHSSSTVLGL
jgi:hypothetical protein